jgi:hypothetical protein
MGTGVNSATPRFSPISKGHTGGGLRRGGLRSLLAVVCATALLHVPAFALPTDEITRAVTATGASDVSSAGPRQFIKAFTAVALRAPARELPDYVTAAVNLRPAIAPNIVAVAIKAAVKHRGEKTEALALLVDHIIRAAIAANPDAAVAIAKAGYAAAPEFRRIILTAAISAAPGEKDALLQAATSKSVPLAFLTFSAADSGGFSFGPSTLNPANITEVGDDENVASPEQPPVH